MVHKPTQSQRLVTLAAEMKDALTQHPGWRQVPLAGGLTIVLQRKDDQWRLALGRRGVPPSATEIAVCAEAFGVPEGSEPSVQPTTRPHPKTGQPVHWLIAELRWIEPTPTA